jgi:hypothetical protein
MVHEGAGVATFRLVRSAVFGLWFVLVATIPLHHLAVLPDFLFDAPGILGLIPDPFWPWFTDPMVLTTFRLGLAVLLLAVVAQRRPHRLLVVAAALGVLFFHGFILGFGGFLNHGRFGILYIAILFALAPDPESNPDAPAATLQLGAFLLSVPYALIGLHRFFVGGVEIFTGDALPIYMVLRTFEPGSFSFEISYALVTIPWVVVIMKIGFFVTTVAEALSPLAVFHRRFRHVWLAIIVPFHFVTLFTMNIFFWENLILIALLFTDIPRRIELRIRRFRPHDTVQPAPSPPTP